MAESALIVHVPEAEPVVHRLRERFHPAAVLGVPAHVTLLYPFMAPEAIDDGVRDVVRAAVFASEVFRFSLSMVGRFPETTYLVPEPPDPFVALIRRLALAFPEFPPFGGVHQAIVPHLTVAHGSAADAELAEHELSVLIGSHGPIDATCKSVTLLENSSGRWRAAHVFRLAEAGAA